MVKTALILGANGRFGGTLANAFWQEPGWHVRIFDRRTDDLESAAQGVDVIVNGWSPPYDRWAAELPGLTEKVISAARSSGARIVFPGNLYVYGAGSGPALSHATPHLAENPLGLIRREIEAMYRDAGVPVLILRAGDFIDTEMSGNWFDRIITKPLAKGRIDYPSDTSAPHAWVFLPDLGRACIGLLECDLPKFSEMLFPGYTLSGQELSDALSEAVNAPVTPRAMAWWPIQLLAMAQPLMRGVIEMRYLWDMPHRVDATQFEALLPEFSPTPVVDALRLTAPVQKVTGAHPPTPNRGAILSQRCCPQPAR